MWADFEDGAAKGSNEGNSNEDDNDWADFAGAEEPAAVEATTPAPVAVKKEAAEEFKFSK